MYRIENEFSLSLDNKYLFIVPVSRLFIKQKIVLKDVFIYPPDSLNIDELFKYDFSFDEDQIFLRKEIVTCTLFVFYVDPDVIKCEFNLMSKYYDYDILNVATSKVEPILDVFRYYFCNYNSPYSLPSKAGQIKDGRCTALIKGMVLVNKIAIDERYISTFRLGSGLNIGESSLIVNCNIFKDNVGEVGVILKHALTLNSSILQQDNLTSKFSQIMTLFEYLSCPYEFQKFQDLKKYLAVHIATDNSHYQKLLDRFKYLTKGEVKNIGYRTDIVHNGKRIEDIVSDKKELLNLFGELQFYICSVIEEMLLLYDKDWLSIDEIRKELINKLAYNNIVNNKSKYDGELSRVIVFVDVRYLWAKILEVTNFYKQCQDFDLQKFIYFFTGAHKLYKSGRNAIVYLVQPHKRYSISSVFIGEINRLHNHIIDDGYYNVRLVNLKSGEKFCDKVDSIVRKKCMDKNRFFGSDGGFGNVLIFADNSHCTNVAKKLSESTLNLEIGFSRSFNAKTKIDGRYLYVVSDYIVAQSMGIERANL